MKHALVLFAATLALAACNRQAPEPPPLTSTSEFALTCGGPFVRTASAASLAEAFGAANVTEETTEGNEGEARPTTVLFAADPTKRVEVKWQNETARSGLLSATATGAGAVWRGPGDVAIGGSLDDVARVNGAPFELAGFGWLQGGVVTDWRGGALNSGDCLVDLQFAPAADTPEAAKAAVNGEGVFGSDSAEMRAANPRVARMSIGYPPS